MARLESSFKNMLLTLLGVTFIASAGVGFVYEITKGPKAETERKRQIAAIQAVLPQFTNNPLSQKYAVPTKDGDLLFYPATLNDEPVGTAVETFTDQGFGGRIRLMVGFLPDHKIHQIAVLEHTETPGLGDKIDPKKSDFIDQFSGKDPNNFTLQVQKDGGDVDGITAATVSSRAFCEAVQRAVDAVRKQTDGTPQIIIEVETPGNK